MFASAQAAQPLAIKKKISAPLWITSTVMRPGRGRGRPASCARSAQRTAVKEVAEKIKRYLVHRATLYGTTYVPHTGVPIVSASFIANNFFVHLKTKPEFTTLKTADGRYELYTWTEHFGHKMMAERKPAVEPEGIRQSSRASNEGQRVPQLCKLCEMHEHMFHEFMEHPQQQSVGAAFSKPDMVVYADCAPHLVAALEPSQRRSQWNLGNRSGGGDDRQRLGQP